MAGARARGRRWGLLGVFFTVFFRVGALQGTPVASISHEHALNHNAMEAAAGTPGTANQTQTSQNALFLSHSSVSAEQAPDAQSGQTRASGVSAERRAVSTTVAILAYAAVALLLVVLTVYFGYRGCYAEDKPDRDIEGPTEHQSLLARSCARCASCTRLGLCERCAAGARKGALPALPSAAQIVNWSKQQSFGVAIIQELFDQADKRRQGLVTPQIASDILRRLSISPSAVATWGQGDAQLTARDLCSAMGKHLPDLSSLAALVNEGKERNHTSVMPFEWGPERLQRLLTTVQREELSLRECRILISEASGGARALTHSQLSALLCNFATVSRNNFWFSVYRFRHVYHNMDRPIFDYFVSSARSVLGSSARRADMLSALQRALLMGCRSLELLIQNGPDGRPMLFRAADPTVQVGLSDALSVIARCAFLASHYPVLLCVQDMCASPAQTDRAVRLFKSKLGNRLVRPRGPLRDRDATTLSPDILMERFLVVELERPGPRSAPGGMGQVVGGETAGVGSSHHQSGTGDEKRPLLQRPLQVAQSVFRTRTQPQQRQQQRIAHGEERLIGTPTHSEGDIAQHTTVEKGATSCSTCTLLTFQELFLLRAPGKGGRNSARWLSRSDMQLRHQDRTNAGLESATDLDDGDAKDTKRPSEQQESKTIGDMTPDPLDPNSNLLYAPPDLSSGLARARGIQCSPVKFSSRSSRGLASLYLSQGWFANNGGCGYVVKPNWLRQGATQDPAGGRDSNKSVSILIISAHFLPSSRSRNAAAGERLTTVQPRVVMRITGAVQDSRSFMTQEGSGSWLHFRWSNPLTQRSAAHSFPLSYPSIAQVTFQVLEETGATQQGPENKAASPTSRSTRPLAQASAPVTCLRSGFRVVPLYDHHCKPVFGFLFVRLWSDFAEIYEDHAEESGFAE